MGQNEWFRMETINRARALETHFRCYELGHIGTSVLDEKDGIGAGITLLIGSPARWNGTRASSSLPHDMWQDILRCFWGRTRFLLPRLLPGPGTRTGLGGNGSSEPHTPNTLEVHALITGAGQRHVGVKEKVKSAKWEIGWDAPGGGCWRGKATRFNDVIEWNGSRNQSSS